MNKEEEHSNKCPICGRPTYKESKYCIFHASAEEKTEEEFKKALKEYIQGIKEKDKDYNFKGFIFIGDIDFKEDLDVTFFKKADFSEATFEGHTNFYEATFRGGASFREATFEENAVFQEVTFEGITGFKGTTFGGHAYFKGTTFGGDADFKGAIFRENVSFGETTFEGDVSFGEATFEGDVSFGIKTIKKDMIFSNALFNQGKTLEINTLKIMNKVVIKFDNAYLENVYLELILGKKTLIYFNTKKILQNYVIKGNQIKNHILQEEWKEFVQAKEVYLRLKNNFHSIGRYDDESWAFKKEKDMERKSYFNFKTIHKWLWSYFLNAIYGYGEKPGRVIVSAILVILLFASLFTIFGISNVGIEQITSNNFFNCIYFSTITFTTLGYGDFRPLEGWGRILAGSEAFIGAFMMALFVYTFARRTGGR